MTLAEENAALRERISYLEDLLSDRLKIESERLVRFTWSLSASEARIAGMLALASPRALAPRELEVAISRSSRGEFSEVVKVYVSHVRRKLGGGIKYLHGLGYSMSPELAGRVIAIGMLAQ